MAAPMDDSVPGDNKEPASWTTVVKRGATKETVFPIFRSVKIGTHWARVFYDGQVQEPAVKTPTIKAELLGSRFGQRVSTRRREDEKVEEVRKEEDLSRRKRNVNKEKDNS
ncbi:hypothetical protein Bbelb_235460, partial [Branchiostoma belcheri]